jgi:hypothetical protein
VSPGTAGLRFLIRLGVPLSVTILTRPNSYRSMSFDIGLSTSEAIFIFENYLKVPFVISHVLPCFVGYIIRQIIHNRDDMQAICTFQNITYCNVLVGSIHDGTLLHSKSQYTTVKHSRQLSEHTYTSGPHGLGTLTPIEFFQQDLLWQSSSIHSNSCSQKASKHKSGQSIVGLSVLLHTTTAPRHIINLPFTCPDNRMSSLERFSNLTV